MSLTVGYWDIRGLVTPIHMACVYGGVAYKVKDYTRQPETSSGCPEWFDQDKKELVKKNAFINLPYIIDGEEIVSQSIACLNHVGRKAGLLGETSSEINKNEQVLGQILDVRNPIVAIVYGDKAGLKDRMTAHFNGCVKVNLDKLEAWLAQTKTKYFSSNEKPLTADFVVFEVLDQHEHMKTVIDAPSPLSTRPHLKAFYESFKSIAQFEEFFKSKLFTGRPINNSSAAFPGPAY